MEARPTRVLVVDDSPDVAGALARFIRMQPDMEDVGTRENADDLVEAIRDGVDVAVVDLTMPGVCPVDAIREAARSVPSCRVIAYSGYDDDETVTSALSAGAHACVSKHADISSLIETIREAARDVHSE